MSRTRNFLTLFCVVGALWGCARQPEVEREADITEDVAVLLPDQPTDPAIVTAEPTMARTVFANDWVAVAHVTLEPGGLIPPHDAGVRFVYALSDCTLSVVDNGGEEVVHMAPGEFTTWPAGQLSLANIAVSPGELLVVERSPVDTSPDLETLPVPDSAVEMERHGTVLLDDDNGLAVDISLAQLASDPLPPNLPMLVVALSACDLQFEGPAVADSELVLTAGEAAWQTPGYGVVTNVGDTQAHVLVVGFRR
jgi:hypothetical protein